MSPIAPDQLPVSRHILRLFERMRVIEARLSVLEHPRQGRSAEAHLAPVEPNSGGGVISHVTSVQTFRRRDGR